jgi:glycosyltransferase involved in cell wall biosynthesis
MKRLVNVLYLTNNAGRASTTVATRGWLEHLMPRGLRPVIASPIDGEFQEWVEGEGGAFYRVDLPFPDRKRPLHFMASLGRLLRAGIRHRIDLVHCNEQEIYPIGQYLGRLLRVPVVVTVHFTMLEGFSQWAFRGARCPDRMFFVSGSNLEACRSGITGVVPESRWRVLYNGLDLKHFRPDAAARTAFRDRHRLGDTFLIASACMLRPRKQLEHLFEVVARIPDPSVRVAVGGAAVPGDEEYAAQLLEDGRRRLGERLIYLGHQDDLRPLYNAADLFVNTSREESFGLTALESMACGCPVVGYPSISVGEVILPGGGEIVEQDDIDRLANAIARRVHDRRETQATRAAARARAEYFDIGRMSEQLWEEYGSLLDAGPERSHLPVLKRV